MISEVSIIVPCFNKERFVLSAVESCLAQTVGGIQVIVVDDGSTDGSVASLQGVSKRITLLTGANQGVCAARNRGLEVASGQWVHFLDADDCLHPQAIEAALAGAERYPEASIVSSRLVDVDESFAVEAEGVEDVSSWLEGVMEFRSSLTTPYLPAASLIRLSLLRSVGRWDEELTRWTDLEYQMRIAARVPKVLHLDLPLYFYRHHSSGQISDANHTLAGYASAALALDRAEGAIRASEWDGRLVDEYLAPFHLHLGRTALACGNGRKARWHFWKAARYRREFRFWGRALIASTVSLLLGPTNTSQFLEHLLSRVVKR